MSVLEAYINYRLKCAYIRTYEGNYFENFSYNTIKNYWKGHNSFVENRRATAIKSEVLKDEKSTICNFFLSIYEI